MGGWGGVAGLSEIKASLGHQLGLGFGLSLAKMQEMQKMQKWQKKIIPGYSI